MQRLGKRWTQEDIETLYSFAGSISFQKLATRLGRTPKAIEHKMCQLGIASTRVHKGVLSAKELASALGIDSKVVVRWSNDHGLPVSTTNVRYGEGKYKSHRIDPEEFWKWAKKNKDLIDFYKIEKHAIIPEPAWVDEERAKDYHTIPRKQHQYWTEEEDKALWRMYYGEGRMQKEIATIMNRSRKSVEKRIRRLREQKI